MTEKVIQVCLERSLGIGLATVLFATLGGILKRTKWAFQPEMIRFMWIYFPAMLAGTCATGLWFDAHRPDLALIVAVGAFALARLITFLRRSHTTSE